MVNKWKISTIILIVAVLILAGVKINDYRESKDNYNFDGIEINKNVFEEMADKFPENTSVIGLCRFSDRKCVGVDTLK